MKFEEYSVLDKYEVLARHPDSNDASRRVFAKALKNDGSVRTNDLVTLDNNGTNPTVLVRDLLPTTSWAWDKGIFLRDGHLLLYKVATQEILRSKIIKHIPTSSAFTRCARTRTYWIQVGVSHPMEPSCTWSTRHLMATIKMKTFGGRASNWYGRPNSGREWSPAYTIGRSGKWQGPYVRHFHGIHYDEHDNVFWFGRPAKRVSHLQDDSRRAG